MNLVRCIVLAAVAVWLPLPVDAVWASLDDVMDTVTGKLSLSNARGDVRARLSGSQELEYYQFFQPRTTVYLDARAGSSWYGFVEWRMDRGYDPRGDRGLRGRLDQYALRFTPWSDGRLSMQAGKFATVVGQWTRRYHSWQNAFISAPLMYEYPTGLSDRRVQYSPYSLVAPMADSGYPYNAIIQGPAYATGLAASGRVSAFEWTAELKSAALMSHPVSGSWDRDDFRHPAASARVAWHPDLRWTFGFSASHGSFPARSATYAIPDGYSRGDYVQRAFLFDIGYAHRYLQIWAELVHSRFTLPSLDTLHSTAWFVEAKFRFTPRFHAAVRWNQQVFSEVRQLDGPIGKWGVDTERIDGGVTFRLSAYTQLQFEANHHLRAPGFNLDRTQYAVRLTLRF